MLISKRITIGIKRRWGLQGGVGVVMNIFDLKRIYAELSIFLYIVLSVC